jgi:probable phosphomutase (TIGR03848 family)
VRFDRSKYLQGLTTFLLIRHALCDPVGRSIAGRKPGVHLNDLGRQQAERLAERLRPIALEGVYSSPLERALETARPIASSTGRQVQTADAWNEIDFGDWTGRTLADLDPLPEWRRFNTFRSSSTIPGGESMAEVLGRVLRDVDRLRSLHPAPTACVAVVSHGDVLRSLVVHMLGAPLDEFRRVEISPASVSILEITDETPRLLLLNSTDPWPSALGAA